MHAAPRAKLTARLRRMGYCLVPVLLGAGAALVLLMVAGRPARPAYAANLTYPGCAATIQLCIDNATAGDTILISAGDYTESLTLSKAVSLTGALSSTTILHALPNTRVLTVTGAAVDSSVVISGLTFAGGHAVGNNCPAGCGGAILITATAQPLLVNLTISNSLADLFGGGLYSDSGSPLVMWGVAVLSNTSSGTGGGLYAKRDVTLSGTQFAGNTTASADGGGVYATGNVILNGGSFVGNTAGVNGWGGGVFAGAAATLTSISFISNTAGFAYTTGGFGGGLYASSAVVMSDAHFIHNFASGWGGGLFTYGGVTASGSTFISNRAASGNGGGLYAGSAAVVNGAQFFSNTANFHGGGLYTGDAGRLSDTQFVGNKSGSNGGGLFVWSAAILAGASFTSNIAASGGGLYAANGGNGFEGISLIGTRFVSNSASTGNGGGLVAGGGAVTLSMTEFVSNTASVGKGGGAYVVANDVARPAWLINNLFAGNRAGSQGDGLFGYFGSSGAVIVHTTFADPGLDPGAAIYVANGAVTISDSIIASYTVGLNLAAGTAFQDYNLFFANGTDVSDTVNNGAHSLTGDPLFVNPVGGDYHLSSGSLAIDAGADAGVTTDFDGDPRPQGAGFDMGFDESPFTAVADVGLIKSASAGMRQPGQALTYTLIYSNSGPQVAAAVRLTDIVPANVVAVTYTSSGAALTPVGLTPYAWQVANLAPGAGGIVTATGVLSGGLHGSVFTNTASISTAGSDTNAANNTSAVGVTVANVAPVGADDVYTLTGNTTFTVTAPGVLGNDTDANNDSLTAILAAGPLTGTLNLHPDGSFTYTPALGYSGVVTFTYRANDGLADSNTATVTLTVTPPVANLGLVKSASASLLAPGQRLTYTLVYSNAGPSLAAGVRLTDIVPANLINIGYTSSGAVLTPVGLTNYAWQVANLAPGAGGIITVTGVLASHTRGTVFTNTATITSPYSDTNPANNTSAVSVTVANVPPVAADDAYTVTGNSTLTVTAPGVLANDTDANGDPLTVVVVTNPLTGTVNLDPDGAFTYTPPHGFAGVVTFTYRANDGLVDSNTATVTIVVKAASYKVYLPLVMKP